MKRIPLSLLFLFVTLAIVPLVLAHTWTAKSGHKLEGEFDKLEDGIVHIALPTGKTGKVKLDLLTETDQKFAKEQQAAKDESPFEVGEAAPKVSPVAIATKKIEMTESVKESVTLTVEGVGSTFENAKTDAFRNAVNEVVGTIVDAETRVTQEKVLEQVLTASNAYVEKHKILSQEQKDGLWHVKMEATVPRQSLQMRLGESVETTKVVDGASLLGRIETKAASEDEPVLLLAKQLRDQNFPYSVMEATAEMVKDPVKKDGDNLVMQLNVTVKGNAQKFDEFRKAIEPTLEKLALSKRTMNLTSEKDRDDYFIVDPPISDMGYSEGYTHTFKADSIFVYLNTTRNSSARNTGWNGYELPYKNVLLLTAYGGIVPVVEISLNDSEGNAIVTKRFGCYIRRHANPYNCTNTFTRSWQYFSEEPNPGQGSRCLVLDKWLRGNTFAGYSPYVLRDFCLAPFFSTGQSGGGRCEFISEANLTPTVTLEPNELKSIKTIKCTVLSQNPDMDEYYRKLPELLKNWQLPKKAPFY